MASLTYSYAIQPKISFQGSEAQILRSQVQRLLRQPGRELIRWAQVLITRGDCRCFAGRAGDLVSHASPQPPRSQVWEPRTPLSNSPDPPPSFPPTPQPFKLLLCEEVEISLFVESRAAFQRRKRWSTKFGTRNLSEIKALTNYTKICEGSPVLKAQCTARRVP